jgi:hypothetical protein
MCAAPVNLGYAPAAPSWRRKLTGLGAHGILVRLLLAYLVACSITIRLIDTWWVGEIPMLALIQLPKIGPAQWLRQHVVMPLIVSFGKSSGSFSPDYVTAGPYALAIVYVLAVGLVLLVGVRRMRSSRRDLAWALVLVAVAVIDFALTLRFARGPGLSIY